MLPETARELRRERGALESCRELQKALGFPGSSMEVPGARGSARELQGAQGRSRDLGEPQVAPKTNPKPIQNQRKPKKH